MKIQTKAALDKFKIDGQNIPLTDKHVIDLEFSAIDTGGGFKDPMLDFSVSVSGWESPNHQQTQVELSISDTEDREQQIEFSYQGALTIAEGEVNGRITEEDLTKEVIRFVFGLLQ